MACSHPMDFPQSYPFADPWLGIYGVPRLDLKTARGSAYPESYASALPPQFPSCYDFLDWTDCLEIRY